MMQLFHCWVYIPESLHTNAQSTVPSGPGREGAVHVSTEMNEQGKQSIDTYGPLHLQKEAPAHASVRMDLRP